MGLDYSQTMNNVDIYIGNSLVFSENAKCAGGPFMEQDDYENSYTSSEKYVGVWRHGEEAWCNLEGRYTHIVANYTH